MPIYEYVCESCGESTEALRKISDPPLTCCPSCGKDALRKKVSAAAFRLKGGGWYETDFKTGNKKNLAGSEGGGGKGDDTGDSKKSGGDDSKPAADKPKSSAGDSST